MRYKFLIIMMLIASIPLSASEFKNTGHSGANFLQIPIEPVGAALGNSYVAMAKGVEGLYWNPGAITYTQGTEMLISTADWILDTQISHLGLVHNFGEIGSFGVAVTALTMDDMEITTPYQPDGTGEMFGAGDYAFGVTYARQLTDRFSFGATVKYVYEYIWEASSSSVAFDFGSVFRTGFYNLRIGMNISNFGANMKMSGDPIDNKLAEERALKEENNPRTDRLSEEYTLPQVFNVGVAFDPYLNEMHRVTVSATANDPNDNQSRMSFGTEYAFQEMFMVRAGYKVGYDEQRFSVGLGTNLNFGSIHARLDYGYSEFGILGDIHYFSFKIGF